MDNIKKALSYGLKLGFEDLEIYMEEGQELDLEIRDGDIEKFQESKSKGLGIRGIKNKKHALVFGTSLDLEELKSNIDRALEIVNFMDYDDSLLLNSDEKFEGVVQEALIKKIIDTPLEDKISYLKEIEKQGQGPETLKGLVESSSYGEVLYKRSIFNTRGLEKIESGAYVAASISLAIDKKGVKETGYSYSYSRDVGQLFKRELGREAYGKAKEMLGADIIASGKYQVILNNEIVVDLLRLIASSFNGENILKNKSMFQGRKKQQILSNKITIIDDGVKRNTLGEKFFDGEGTNVKENILVEKGIFIGGIYNLSIAKKSGTATTGNCIRSYSSFPDIGYHNLSILKGEVDIGAIIENLDSGLMIKELMGLHMANPITGEFSLGASGLLIKNGELASGFRGVTISGNLNDLFNQVVEVGSDFEYKGSIGAPSLLVRDVIISGS